MIVLALFSYTMIIPMQNATLLKFLIESHFTQNDINWIHEMINTVQKSDKMSVIRDGKSIPQVMIEPEKQKIFFYKKNNQGKPDNEYFLAVEFNEFRQLKDLSSPRMAS